MLVLAARAEATVTQVDGTILPVTTGMQQALDANEPVGALDAVQDAAEVPQIFKPRLGASPAGDVVFKDIRETAGFENSFGWYNIGDDVSTAPGRAANLHPVMGCGVPMNGTGDAETHKGNPAFYFQSANDNDTIRVNFAMEQTAGRYKGGFIGFYLITPEDPANRPERLSGRLNCGDFKDDPISNTNNLSLFGFIYFTQKDLNNDGDFVHHLVYTSSVADRFFFGFEDLFRGGDNDFDDMAMQIDGLTPPCVPSAEVCDGLDNNCNGVIDETSPALPGTGATCLCNGVGRVCDNAPQFGQCQTGVTRCTNGAITCHATGAPSDEVCDGINNNCDAGELIDEGDPGGGGSCGSEIGVCTAGTLHCIQGGPGGLVCQGGSAGGPEQCNGLDDDCNGRIDEGDPDGGASCGTAIGVCTPGTNHCIEGGTGALMCQGGTAGGAELCNGFDDDCDGTIDDNPTDVGQPCGTTGEGECELGHTICVDGNLSCAGEVGPGVERCNKLDDDCDGVPDDNPVDAGQPCGSSIGACLPGVFRCDAGDLVCDGGQGPTQEDCNGVDDDCNGIVDDHVTGDGLACGAGNGPCSGGVQRCIAGHMQCVGGTSGGTETCNGVDDDCDGIIDDGELCNGGVCDHGECATPCLEGESPCPSGKACNLQGYCVNDLCYGITCPNDFAGNLQTCNNGTCVSLCSTLECPRNLQCRGSDGACVLDTCDYLPKCAASEICVDATCQPNPCTDVTCPTGQFCRGGSCVGSCEGVQCGPTEKCEDGGCVATGCKVACGDNKVCNPDTGVCQDDRCVGLMCVQTKTCDPVNGGCIANPCQGVTCPSGQTCSMGQCGSTPHGGRVTTGGGGGCSAGGEGSLGVGLGLMAGLVVLARRRVRRPQGERRDPSRGRRDRRPGRRMRSVWLAVAVLGAVAPLGGCRINDYCLECAANPGGDAGTGSDGGGGGDGGGGSCDPNQVHPEVCNNIDDDCDGQIDEDFDLQTDERNCGVCGATCNKPGAQTKCVAGGCTISACFPGFSDKDGDIAGPYAGSNGCEYSCFVSNLGVEVCDGLDNNCDGVVDETFDKTSDHDNCGVCGRVCEFFGATGHCVASACQFTPASDCEAGFLDIDGLQQNGCEYQCTPSNGGVEACDVRDNNCNGLVDENFQFAIDPTNCGHCGVVCDFHHATASCAAGACRFDPVTGCEAGFVDANHDQLDGCEYQCTRTPDSSEICDGLDNDCNGTADDNPVGAGVPCAATADQRGECRADGVMVCAPNPAPTGPRRHLVCTGATEPRPEHCDGLDEDCDGVVDNGVTVAGCYTGATGTLGIGVCHPGVQACVAGQPGGACTGQVTPSDEQCNGRDDNCNGAVDDAPGGGVITTTCYEGPPGTRSVGTCVAGTATCAFGTFGACAGQVTPTVLDICGDGLDTDCDGSNDAAEGCLALGAERRLDVTGGGVGEIGDATSGTEHAYDVVLAAGFGSKVYAAWSQLVSGRTEVYFRSSTDGGTTWSPIINLTSSVNRSAVKPAIAVAPGATGATDRIVVVYQTVNTGVRDIHVQISTDGGASFGASSATLDAAGDSFHHVVAIRGSNCVVAWEKLDTATLNRDIQSRTSSDGCSTFNTETKINVGTGIRFAGRPQVGLTAAGVVWAWREQRPPATTRDIFAAASATLTAAPAESAVDTDTTNESDFPVLRVNQTSAYLVWQEVSTVSNTPGSGSDVLFARSINGGATWSATRIIDDPAGEVSGSFTPSLAIDPKADVTTDVVAIAWEDRRQGTQVFTSVSSDGGATFATPVRASSNATAPIVGQTSAPQIAAAGGGVLAVAYQNQLTSGVPHVFIATSIDTGVTWTYSALRIDGGLGSALAPQIIAAKTPVPSKPAAVTAWADFRSDQVQGDIYVAVSH